MLHGQPNDRQELKEIEHESLRASLDVFKNAFEVMLGQQNKDGRQEHVNVEVVAHTYPYAKNGSGPVGIMTAQQLDKKRKRTKLGITMQREGDNRNTVQEVTIGFDDEMNPEVKGILQNWIKHDVYLSELAKSEKIIGFKISIHSQPEQLKYEWNSDVGICVEVEPRQGALNFYQQPVYYDAITGVAGLLPVAQAVQRYVEAQWGEVPEVLHRAMKRIDNVTAETRNQLWTGLREAVYYLG